MFISSNSTPKVNCVGCWDVWLVAGETVWRVVAAGVGLRLHWTVVTAALNTRHHGIAILLLQIILVFTHNINNN